MAVFRKVHCSFWSDSFIAELNQQKKLFYLYLLTNEHTHQCGIYEITKRQMAFDIGCNAETITKMLQFFTKHGKIRYNETTNELAIKNWDKYNGSSSSRVQTCVDKGLSDVKDRVLIEYLYSNDTQTQEEEEKEKKQEEEKATNVAATTATTLISSNGKYGDDVLYNDCLKYQKDNPNKYDKEMYVEFLEYWTATIQTGKDKGKELWRCEKTWSLAGRLRSSYELIWKPKQVANPKGNSQKFIIY